MLVAERLPCLATVTPAPAATMAAAVEMLKVLAPSPPVPQVSRITSASTSTFSASALMARAMPTISSRGLALDAQGAEEGGRLGFAGTAAHDLEQHVAGLVLREVAARRQALKRRAQHVIRHGRPPRDAAGPAALPSIKRKLRSRSSPTAVSTLSGWNCTPWTGSSR